MFNIVWPFIAGIIFTVTLRTLPSPLLDWLMQQPADRPALLPQSLNRGIALLIAVIIGIFFIIVVIGVWRFRPWARAAYVIITVIYFVCLFFAPPTVLSAPAFGVFAIGYFVQGIVLAMLFLPPIAQMFATRRV